MDELKMISNEKIGQLTEEEKLLIAALHSKEYRDQIISLLNKAAFV